MEKESEDIELIKLSIEGNLESFRVLFDKYNHRIFCATVAILKNKDDSEEATQEAFMKAYKNLKKFRGDSSFYSWIYRIAINIALDIYNRKKKKIHLKFKMNTKNLTMKI